MTYPTAVVDQVLEYLDSGRSISDIEREFGISKSSISFWNRKRGLRMRAYSPRPVRYPLEVVRKALALAYGNHGFKLRDVACMLDVSVPTISNWKKKYITGGLMEIPGVGPDEGKHLSADKIKSMSPEELEAYIHKLELKADVLEGTVKILKAEGIEELSNDERAILVDALSDKYTKTEALEALGMASSSYYFCKAKQIKPDKYVAARAAIREEFRVVHGRRGYRYIRQRLRMREDPITLSGKTVRRLMAEEGCFVSYIKTKRRYSSYAGEISSAPANIVARNFHADKPNTIWLTDITEFRIPAGKVYLSPIIDCFDGMPVAWRMGTSPNAQMTNSMLDDACSTLKENARPICHSDRGNHYRWPGWIERCERYGIIRSMSKKGCSPDNSAMEGFFGRLKNEFFYDKDWKNVSVEEFMVQLDDYMRYYRDERIKESLGWMSPSQYRKSLGLVA